MGRILDFPYVLFATSAVVQWLAASIGKFIRKRRPAPKEDQQQDFDIVRTATLTLLALIIGFSFQMAISRYDQRKNYEEAEANAIGTEYVRADLLPAEDAAKLRGSRRIRQDCSPSSGARSGVSQRPCRHRWSRWPYRA